MTALLSDCSIRVTCDRTVTLTLLAMPTDSSTLLSLRLWSHETEDFTFLYCCVFLIILIMMVSPLSRSYYACTISVVHLKDYCITPHENL